VLVQELRSDDDVPKLFKEAGILDPAESPMGLEKVLTEHVSCICATALLVAGTSRFSRRGGRLRGFGNIIEEVAGANA